MPLINSQDGRGNMRVFTSDGKRKAGVMFFSEDEIAQARQFLQEDTQTAEYENSQKYDEVNPYDAETDKYGCPNIWGNTAVAMIWEYRFWYTNAALMAAYLTSFIVMAALYGATNEIAGCVHVTHDMLSYRNYTDFNVTVIDTDDTTVTDLEDITSKHLLPLEQRIGRPDLFWFLIWPSVIMWGFHAVNTLWAKFYYNWYYLNVRHEQDAMKYLVSAIPYFFIAFVLASIVGVTDIFLLIGVSLLAGITELCMGYMEWYNANRMRLYNKQYEDLKVVFESEDQQLYAKVMKVIVYPRIEWTPLYIAVIAEMMVFGTLTAFFANAMTEQSGALEWWVIVSMSLYFGVKGLEIIQLSLYWSNIFPFNCYVYTEWFHLFGRFAFFTMITWFVLAGYGKRRDNEDCLYPYAA